MRYLTRACPSREDLSDIRQDVCVKIYQMAQVQRPVVIKPLLLTIARNLIVDRFRHNRIVSIESASDFEGSSVLIDELSPECRLNASVKRFYVPVFRGFSGMGKIQFHAP